ncbi:MULTISPECIES: DUF1707 SHOCT-like domain-containing protein [unclassified Corynebacterium]|uniref:DUF1707 SHOCT-like domain-containing protein n=2 Tax=Corynebacterium TaxID=1716 RepID=UPI00264B6DE4|nr:DUF1707 domain-containing protein [Corynebacterium sp.]MDN6511571.1 DUF1707 domain-containing protein [Corynebacterium sp.]
MNSADGTDRLRLSDNDRIHAMSVLGAHFADGRLDDSEFNERSGAVAAARTLGELRGLFDDLPGGLPFDAEGTAVAVPGQDAALDPATETGLAARDPEAAEVESLRKRGNLVQSIDGAILGVTLVTFLLLQFVFDVSNAWIVWPSLIVTLSVPRMLLKYSDEDEELFEEIKEADQETRKDRLRRAAERMQELESRDRGRERDDRD